MKSVSEKKRPGRPRLGNVLFARRLSPSKIKEIESLLKGSVQTSTNGYSAGDEETSKLKSQIKSLLDDSQRLADEKARLEEKLDKCARATDDEKAHRWMLMYDQVRARLKYIEDSQ